MKEKKFYSVVLHFDDDSIRVVIAIDDLDSILESGYVVEILKSVNLLLD